MQALLLSIAPATAGGIWSKILTILFAILFFGFIIALHEFGHFSTAKLFGVKVNEYAIGMGPALLKRKKGETQYSLRLLPIGGYVSLEGEDEVSEDPRAFGNQKAWKRFIVIAAGATLNIILGLVLIGLMLGITGTFLADLSDTVIETSHEGYPELREKAGFIRKVISEEEAKFNNTIDQGLVILGEMTDALQAAGSKVLAGPDAFKLYDTYGFPLDLTKEILAERGDTVDEEGFAACMKEQRERARNARKKTNYMGADVTVYQSIDPSIHTTFVGYDNTETESQILVLTTEEELVDALTDGQNGTIITAETPFYATSGGQHADTGLITLGEGNVFEVKDTVKLQGDKIGHIGVVKEGMFKMGDVVKLSIDTEKRAAAAKNHSATHLLQKALREVLGSHVEQAGSEVDRDRLRFDFTHFSAMTPEELKKVEDLVNEKIREGLAVNTAVMSLEDAKKTGAMALFGEKYGDEVRVVKMGDFSTELCGGTHVRNTEQIQCFKILSEASVSAGVRRIEALTAGGLMDYYAGVETELKSAAAAAKTTPDALENRILQMQAELKALSQENEKLKSEAARSKMGDAGSEAVEVGAFKVLAKAVPGVDMNELRGLGDQLKDKLGDCVVVLASEKDGRVNLIAMATEAAQKAGAHSGNIIKGIAGLVGGGGGGKPGMAQAGGKNPAGIQDALDKALELIKGQLQ